MSWMGIPRVSGYSRSIAAILSDLLTPLPIFLRGRQGFLALLKAFDLPSGAPATGQNQKALSRRVEVCDPVPGIELKFHDRFYDINVQENPRVDWDSTVVSPIRHP